MSQPSSPHLRHTSANVKEIAIEGKKCAPVSSQFWWVRIANGPRQEAKVKLQKAQPGENKTNKRRKLLRSDRKKKLKLPLTVRQNGISITERKRDLFYHSRLQYELVQQPSYVSIVFASRQSVTGIFLHSFVSVHCSLYGPFSSLALPTHHKHKMLEPIQWQLRILNALKWQ